MNLNWTRLLRPWDPRKSTTFSSTEKTRLALPWTYLLLFLCMSLSCQGQAGPSPSITSQDVRALNDLVTSQHVFPYGSVSKVGQDAFFAHLAGRVGKWSQSRILVEMMRGIAELKCGNTELILPKGVLPRLPLSFQAFADGIFVSWAQEPFRDLLGYRFVSLNSRSAQEVTKKLSELIAHENQSFANHGTGHLLAFPHILDGLGLLGKRKTCHFVFAHKSGKRLSRTWTVSDWSLEENGRTVEPAFFHETKVKDLLRFQELDQALWSSYLPKKKTLYVRYSRAEDLPGQIGIALATKNILGRMKKDDVERLVLDIRVLNRGQCALNRTFIEGLEKSVKINRPGGLFVLIGKETKAAGVHLAFALEAKTQAVFVGQATGQGSDHYAEPVIFHLPDCGLQVCLPQTHWALTSPAQRRDALYPDVLVENTYANLVAGVDSCVVAVDAFEMKKKPDIAAAIKSRQRSERSIQYFGHLRRPPQEMLEMGNSRF